MPTKWRRIWPATSLLVALFVVAAIHFAAHRYARETPNYSMIENGLWQGGIVGRPPPGVVAVLNLCETDDSFRVPTYKWAPIGDAPPAPSLEWLRTQVEFIEEEHSAGHGVFVHCQNEISRSTMVLAAYLMKQKNWSVDQALDYLQRRRPGVRPNPAFLKLVYDWEELATSKDNR